VDEMVNPGMVSIANTQALLEMEDKRMNWPTYGHGFCTTSTTALITSRDQPLIDGLHFPTTYEESFSSPQTFGSNYVNVKNMDSGQQDYDILMDNFMMNIDMGVSFDPASMEPF
ncbi:hypothetical protein, partial [Heyndrickxia coagulans]|uniref:hypothetical protein n=1 Tax=Heyndrickxia coagulans TaxID=1398 RepID=UPI00214DC6E8